MRSECAILLVSPDVFRLGCKPAFAILAGVVNVGDYLGQNEILRVLKWFFARGTFREFLLACLAKAVACQALEDGWRHI